MGIPIADNTKKVGSMEKGSIFGQMGLHMRVAFVRGTAMVEEDGNQCKREAMFMLANTKWIRSRARGNINGLMGADILAPFSKISSKIIH